MSAKKWRLVLGFSVFALIAMAMAPATADAGGWGRRHYRSSYHSYGYGGHGGYGYRPSYHHYPRHHGHRSFSFGFSYHGGHHGYGHYPSYYRPYYGHGCGW